MKEKKGHSYGGIEKRYEAELADAVCGSLALSFAVRTIMEEMSRDDEDHGDIMSGWMNSAYELLRKVERKVANLEEAVMADPQFSDMHKRRFVAELLDPVKDGNRKARRIDAAIMNGEPCDDLFYPDEQAREP